MTTISEPQVSRAIAVPAHSGSRPGSAPGAVDIGLAKNRDFRTVLMGQGISAIGDAVSTTTMPLLALFLTGSGLQMGIVGVLQRLPDLLFGLPAGAYADRWDRRRMMLWADVGRAGLTALIPLAAILELPVMAVVFVVLFPINVCRVLFMAGWTATIPNLVARDQLGRAHGVFAAISGLSYVIGPAVAGLLVTQIGAALTLGIDAVTFVISAVSLTFIQRSLRSSEAVPPVSLVHEIGEGIRFVAHHPVLRDALAFSSFVSLVAAPVIPVVTFYITVDRGLPASAFGFVISVYSIGTLLGALLGSRRMTGRLASHLLVGNLLVGLTTAGVALASSLPIMLVCAFASGASQAIVLVAAATLRAANSPDALLGRVGSTARTLSAAIQPIGLLIGGLLLDLIGGGSTLLIIAGVTVLASVGFTLSPGIRRAHAMPPAVAEAIA